MGISNEEDIKKVDECLEKRGLGLLDSLINIFIKRSHLGWRTCLAVQPNHPISLQS